MAICGNCNAQTARIRSCWAEDGTQLQDECPQCAPGSFDKVTDASDKKIWMGYEAHPNEYVKRYDKDGLIYDRKPEYRSEQEQRLSQMTAEEQDAQARAMAKKRAERRTTPMDSVELATAMRKAEKIAEWVVQSAAQGRDVN